MFRNICPSRLSGLELFFARLLPVGEVLDELDGTISVSEGGAIVLDDEKKKSSEISHLDGTRTTVESPD